MMRKLIAGFVFLVLALLLSALALQDAPDPWEIIAPGIAYQEFHLPAPNNVYVARMDRSNLNVTIDSSLAQGKLSGAMETVRGMAARYDEAINYWGRSWGARNKVAVAINGFYYNMYTGIPQNGVMNSGWYAKRFDELGGNTGFAWKLDRSAFIGQCVYHNPDKQIVTFVTASVTQLFDGINVPRENDHLTIYTPQYDANTRTDNNGLEVLVEMTRTTSILPSPAMATGYVREIHNNQGSTPIPFDHIVLSASGTARTALLAKVHLGDQVGISQEITHYKTDCVTPLNLDWTKTYASLGGDFYFLQGGVVQPSAEPGALERHPRTAIAFNSNYIYFVVVDGRDPYSSIGMTIEELAIFARDTLSATEGIAQDGGGSSTMVINGKLMNNTFCNINYCKSKIFLPLLNRSGTGLNGQDAAPNNLANSPGNEPASPIVERPVADGMMMIVVEPVEKSTKFTTGDPVVALSSTDLRLGPGTNYATLASIPAGTPGVILTHLNNLNGVLAKGSLWWMVYFGAGWVGWAPEVSLIIQMSSDISTRSGGTPVPK